MRANQPAGQLVVGIQDFSRVKESPPQLAVAPVNRVVPCTAEMTLTRKPRHSLPNTRNTANQDLRLPKRISAEYIHRLRRLLIPLQNENPPVSRPRVMRKAMLIMASKQEVTVISIRRPTTAKAQALQPATASLPGPKTTEKSRVHSTIKSDFREHCPRIFLERARGVNEI